MWYFLWYSGMGDGMLATIHVIAGAAIGGMTVRPELAFVGGIASHLVMDAMPHWGDRDRATFLRVARVDGVCSLVAACAAVRIAGSCPGSVVAGIAGGLLLDLDKPSRHFFGGNPFPPWVQHAHSRIQKGKEASHRLGGEIAVGAGLAALAVPVLVRRSRRSTTYCRNSALAAEPDSGERPE